MRSGDLICSVILLLTFCAGCGSVSEPEPDGRAPRGAHPDPSPNHQNSVTPPNNVGAMSASSMRGVWAGLNDDGRASFALWSEREGEVTGQWLLGASSYNLTGTRRAGGELAVELSPFACARGCEAVLEVTLAPRATTRARDDLSVEGVQLHDATIEVPFGVGDVFVPHDGFKPESAPIDTAGLVELEGAGLGAFVERDGELSVLDGTCALAFWPARAELLDFRCEDGVVDDPEVWRTASAEAIVVEGDHVVITLSEDAHLVGEFFRDAEGQIEALHAKFIRGEPSVDFAPGGADEPGTGDVIGYVFMHRRAL